MPRPDVSSVYSKGASWIHGGTQRIRGAWRAIKRERRSIVMTANIDSTASMMILEVLMVVTAVIATGFALKMVKAFYFSEEEAAEKADKNDVKGLVAGIKLS